MKKVALEDMPQDFQDDLKKMWKIFDRGVKTAKAENERLGLVVDESTDYTSTSDLPVEIPLVSESGEE